MNDPSPSVAVALPAKNEAGDLPACLDALDCAAACFAGQVSVVVVANNCSDATGRVLEGTRMRHAALLPVSVSLLPAFRHAGWARRLAFDAAAATLSAADDVLMSTDADTRVSPEWIVRAVEHLRGGIDAVAGRALTHRDDRRALGGEAMRRLNLLGRYYTALDWLRADAAPVPHDPWPRHFYEGGASIALTLGTYRRIGGAPTPSIAEDRALFAAVRESGGIVRHPLDVRVFTSSRLDGRAPGGMADAFARWIAQPIDEPLHETYALPAALDPAHATARDRLTFETLPDAVRCAGAMVRAKRSAPAKQVETVAVATLRADHLDRVAQQRPERLDSVVT